MQLTSVDVFACSGDVRLCASACHHCPSFGRWAHEPLLLGWPQWCSEHLMYRVTNISTALLGLRSGHSSLGLLTGRMMENCVRLPSASHHFTSQRVVIGKKGHYRLCAHMRGDLLHLVQPHVLAYVSSVAYDSSETCELLSGNTRILSRSDIRAGL